MNSTIRNINDYTENMKVRKLAQTLIANKGKLFKAVFTKKNGELRTMVFTTAVNWNPLNGIDTTVSGAQMVATKCAHDMATVCEKTEEGRFQPRTLNLATVITLERV